MDPFWRMVLFFLTMVLVWGGGHAYFGWRFLGSPWKVTDRRRKALWWALAVLAALPPATMLVQRGLEFRSDLVSWVGFLSMGFSSILVSLGIAADLVRRAGEALWGRQQGGTPIDPQRRAFFSDVLGLGVMGSSFTLTAAGVSQAIRVPPVVEVDVKVPGLAAPLEGFRIVQLSDIHIGPTIKRDFLEAVVEQTNALNADLVAVTGDLVDGWVDELRGHVAPLGRLRARHGAFFVTGNHEYYWGAEDWCDEVERLGLRVLNNRHLVLRHDGVPFVVAGCTDHRAEAHLAAHRSDPEGSLEGAPQDAFKLMLAHQPRSLYAAARAGAHLQISGHTHAGQYFPMTLLIHLFQPFVAGLHRHDDTQIYVSRGTGYWGPPLRLGSPSEITLLRLLPG